MVVRGRRRAARRAPSWRRCRRAWPKSVRSSCPRDFRRVGLAARLVGELRRPRARERLRDALRVHARRAVLRPAELLDRPAHLAAREDRDGLRRLPAVPALRPARDDAVALREMPRYRPAPTASPPRRRRLTGHRVTLRPIERRHHRARRLSGRRGVACGIKRQRAGADRAARSGADRRRRRRCRPRRCSRRTRPSPRRSSSRASISARRAAARRPSSSTAAARTRARATRAWTSRGRWPPRPRRPWAARPIRCSSPPRASSACALDIAKVRAGVATRARPLDAAPAATRATRAIMTTDPFPKVAAPSATDSRRRDVHRRRHGERLRHDRAAHGDDARISDDRRGRRARRARARAAARGRPRPSTPSRLTASARPTTACSRSPPARRA